MREIKFRGKRIDTDQWVYGHYFVTPLTDENSGTKPEAGWFFLCGETRHCIVQEHVAFVVDPETVGQYTEIKDENGNEIYENDICRCDLFPTGTFTGKVKMSEGCWWIDSGGASVSLWDETHDLDVLGNIHDNPYWAPNF